LKISGKNSGNKKTVYLLRRFLIILILTHVYINQFRLSRDDDSNDEVLKNSVSLF